MVCQSALDSCLQGADKHFEDCQEAHDHEADVPVHLDQSDPSVGSESENRDNAQVLPLTWQSLACDSFFLCSGADPTLTCSPLYICRTRHTKMLRLHKMRKMRLRQWKRRQQKHRRRRKRKRGETSVYSIRMSSCLHTLPFINISAVKRGSLTNG